MTQIPNSAEPVLRLSYDKLRRRRWHLRWKSLVFIGLPTLAAVLYTVMAPVMYTSEARFAIRGSDAAPGTGGGGLAGMLGAAALGADGFALRDFLQSADALTALDRRADYVARMRGHTAIPFIGLAENAGFNDTLAFYQRNVTVRYSITEQILIMEVSAYGAEDARRLSDDLIKIAEEFANTANERSRRDALGLAESEVKKAEARAAEARMAINQWRMANGNIDPNQQIQIIQTVVTQLKQSLATAQAELASRSSQFDVGSARRKQLEANIASLEAQITAESEKLTSGNRSVANQLAEYQRLGTEMEFAEKQLASAQQSLEQARVTTLRQAKYIFRITQPTMPQQPTHPASLKIILTTLLISSLVYAIGSMVVDMVHDAHR